jgi:hypothetical protein
VSQYTATAQRALATIRRKGAPITFNTLSPITFDEATGRSSGGTPVPVPGFAVEDTSDPDRLAAIGLRLVDPVTLLVAAYGLAVKPVPELRFTWAGLEYYIRDVTQVAPDGTPVTYSVVGSR